MGPSKANVKLTRAFPAPLSKMRNIEAGTRMKERPGRIQKCLGVRVYAPLLLVFLMLGAIPLAAQTTGTIEGTVTDPSGAVLPGAAVSLTHMETGRVRTETTHDDGTFHFPALPVGTYEIRIEREGFTAVRQGNIKLAVGEMKVFTFFLEVGAVAEVLTVEGRLALVNTRSHELSYLVEDDTIADLPLNGRNYTDLALLQPGVLAFRQRAGGSVVAHGLGMSINGRDPRSNVYLLDGTPQNDFTNAPAGSAAGTALGTETVQEFRVAANAYGAEYGRMAGGQIIAVTKSGGNDLHGSLFEYHRNDNFDARNFFDLPGEKPEFKRNQFGATIGGPIQSDRTFFFLGFEGLRERKGRTIHTVAPDDDARTFLLHIDSTTTDQLAVNPDVQPYLLEYPVANGSLIMVPDDPNDPTGPMHQSGLANHTFGFNEVLDQDFFQARVDHHFSDTDSIFVRYTFDDAAQALPTDFPQFPRAFVSTNQFLTAQLSRIQTADLMHLFRFNFARTHTGQDVEANVGAGVLPFVTGVPSLGNIDIGGIPRFGPQISGNVQLNQDVIGGEYHLTSIRGNHTWKMGGGVEQYRDRMFNPTFSRGLYPFPNIRRFLAGAPILYLGLAPGGDVRRAWDFELYSAYLQDQMRVHPRLTLDMGFRYEVTTMPIDPQGRDSALVSMMDAAPTVGRLYKGPRKNNFSPRFGFAWDATGEGKTAVRGGVGIYFNSINHQNLIVTVTNPPVTPRFIIRGAAFPNPDFGAGVGNTMRPIEWNLKTPNVYTWNVNLQQEMFSGIVFTLGYAGSRGIHLMRSGDVNIPQPDNLVGPPSYSTTLPRPNSNFSTIELKRSDGDSDYSAFLLEFRKRWGDKITFQSAFTYSKSTDNTQASTFFSDATNGTTSAFPEFPGFPDFDYNQGFSDFHLRRNWVTNFQWKIPFARELDGVAKSIFDGWHLGGITTMHSGNRLTPFVASNRSLSQWSPSLAPGLGRDRPNFAPGRSGDDAVTAGDPNSFFDPAAFELQPLGEFGNAGRGSLLGPDFRGVDLSLLKQHGFDLGTREATLQFRIEAFNIFNRTNFGTPGLQALSGTGCSPSEPDCRSDCPIGDLTCERPLPPLATFGRIRSTIGSSRQIQFSLRLEF